MDKYLAYQNLNIKSPYWILQLGNKYYGRYYLDIRGWTFTMDLATCTRFQTKEEAEQIAKEEYPDEILTPILIN